MRRCTSTDSIDKQQVSMSGGYDFLLDGDTERPAGRNTPRVSGYGGAAYGSGGRDQDDYGSRRDSGMAGYSGTPVSPFRAGARSTGKPPRTSVLSSGRRTAADTQHGSPRGGGFNTMSTPGRNVRFAEGASDDNQHTPYPMDGGSGRAYTPNSVGNGMRTTPFRLSGPGGFGSTESPAGGAYGGHGASRAGSTPFAGRSSGDGWDRRGSWGADGGGDGTPQQAGTMDRGGYSSSSSGNGGYDERDRDPLRSSWPDESALAPAAAGLNSTLQDLEEVYRYWCIVVGLFPDNNRLDKLYEVFNSRGSVVTIKESTGNWALLKFSSSHEAARAAASNNGSFINSGTILAVTQLSTALAQNMGLRLDEQGEFVGGAGGAMNDGTTFIESSTSGLQITSSSSKEAETESTSTGGLRSRGRTGADGSGSGSGERATRTSLSPSRHPSGLRITTVSGDEIDPAAYLRPVRRQSVCDAILRWFGFQ